MPAEPIEDILVRVQEIALDSIAPRAALVDREGVWPGEGLRALLKAGLGGLVVSEYQGGLGHGLSGLLRVCETIGQHCASTAMCFGMHGVGSAVIAAKATSEQQRLFLDPITRGEHLTTLALSEPGTGAHFYLPSTRITRASSGFLVNGSKSFVTNGGHADSYVLNGVTDEDTSSPGQFSCLVIPGEAEGLRWGEPWRGAGMRGNSSRTVQVEDVAVPRANLLGQEGDHTWYVFNIIAPYFLSAMAGSYLGVAQAALDETIQHLRHRSYAQTGRTLAQNPILQHRLGELWAAQERARRLAYYAAEQGDTGGPDSMPAILSAKSEASETAVRLANECMTLLGGIGYAQGGGVERHLRDARAGPVMAPTTDMLRTWTGRWLLGEPLLTGGP